MQDQATISQFLPSVPLFRGLNERQLQHLSRRFTIRKYEVGESIIQQGHIGVGLFVIMSGTVDVIRTETDGTRTHMATLGKGEFFGEFSLIDEAPRIATVVAQSPVVECLILSRLDFLAVMQQDHEMPLVIMRELVARLRNVLGR